MKLALAIVCTLSILSTAPLAYSQSRVQWASRVITYSSQKGERQYSAEQVLGRPNKCPATGDSPCAWKAATDIDQGDQEEFLKVGFDQPMRVSHIGIAENFYPGAVSKISLYDEKDKERSSIAFTPHADGLTAKVMHIDIMRTQYKVSAIKVTLQPGLVPGENEIDAIGISDDNTPITAEINVVPNIEVGKRENLGAAINSPYDEVLPVIAPDGKTLYIDRKNHPQNYGANDNIWYSTQDANGNWLPAQNIGPTLNNGLGSFVASVTPDGNTLLIGGTFKSQTEAEHFGLWLTHRTKAGWSVADEVRVKNFYTLSKFVEFSLSNDGRVIVISVERKDSFGGKDLYVCFLQADGSWSEPKNMGDVVNSAAEESTPFIASDGKTLYFSSDGFAGYGSLDMYLTRRLDDTWQHWSEPQNLGPQLNSQSWDAYYTVPASGEYAYYVSIEGSMGLGDIWRSKLPESLRPKPVVLIAGKAINAKTGSPVAAIIKYEILKSGKEVGSASTSPTDGVYKITLPAGEQYGYRAEAKGYVPVSENLDLTSMTNYQELQRNLMLVPIEKGQVVRLNNIFFETAKSELRPESFSELDRVVKLLNDNPTMEILIGGHTDNVGAPGANKSLSEARAKSVEAYLVSKGVSEQRLKAKGFGDAKPMADNNAEEGRQKNRRVEFTILK